MSLLMLPWKDILCQKIFPYLSLVDVFGLKQVSKDLRHIVMLYIKDYCNVFDFSSCGKNVKMNNV